MSDAKIDLEFRHLWKVYKDLTGHKTPHIIIIDSRGIDSRRKSLFAKRQKRVDRIVERGVTRVSEQNVSMMLKSAELILLMSAIVNTLKGKQSSKWMGMSPVSMENIALFVPA